MDSISPLTDLLDTLITYRRTSAEVAETLERFGPVAAAREMGRQEILELVFEEAKRRFGAIPPPLEPEEYTPSTARLSADEYVENVRQAEDA